MKFSPSTLTLCAASLLAVTTTCLISLRGGAIPENLDRLASAALGALSGLAVPAITNRSSDRSQDDEVAE